MHSALRPAAQPCFILAPGLTSNRNGLTRASCAHELRRAPCVWLARRRFPWQTAGPQHDASCLVPSLHRQELRRQRVVALSRRRTKRTAPLDIVAERSDSGNAQAVSGTQFQQEATPTGAPGKVYDRVVCKFGGSSVADAERMREVARLVRRQIELSRQYPVVVLSAMGSTTNDLIAAGDAALYEGIVDSTVVRNRAYAVCDALGLDREALVDPLLMQLDQLLMGVKFIRELSPRTRDYLVSFGERLSVRIFAAHLLYNEGLPARAFDAFDVGFRTDSNFQNAEILEETYDLIRSFFERVVSNQTLAVITGFIAKDNEGHVTTLGRGGSDLTATTLGAALGATEVQVWKDVDGIMTTDPRLVPNAIPVAEMSFEEAAELAYFGAKVLHPVAMQPALRFNIPVRVKNSYNPEAPGTVILRRESATMDRPVTALSVKRGVQLVDIVSTRMVGAYGFLARVFACFATHQLSVDVIATSEVSLSLTLDANACDMTRQQRIIKELQQIAQVSFSSGRAIISIISNVRRSSEILARAMKVLHEQNIEVQMISQGASKFNISLVVHNDEAITAVRALHDEFFHCSPSASNGTSTSATAAAAAAAAANADGVRVAGAA
jgi:aspartate kinase